MKLDTAKHSRDYLRDTLAKLQAMQKCDNKALQVYLQEPLLLHFYTATAVHREAAKRIRDGAWRFYLAPAQHEQAAKRIANGSA